MSGVAGSTAGFVFFSADIVMETLAAPAVQGIPPQETSAP
jgi:hypothetical protein